jgi:two-component system, NtrC family, sensor histidine kinase HydH
MKGERIVAAPYRWPIRILLGTLAVISAGLIAVTLLNYHTTSRLAEQALQNTGLSMALEVAAEARALGARDAAALQALVAGQHRREIAYLAIGERDGTIIAHTNPRLVGYRLDDPAFSHARDTGRLVGKIVVLGTGEEVYELTVPFHIPPAGPGGVVDVRQPRFRILRIALHTAPARQIVYQAQAQLLFAAMAVLVLATLSGWQVRTLRRYFVLQRESARQERLAALGEMAAVLAHEIRNPLGAIKGLAQFLGEKQAADPAQSEMTRTIADEATRLERLVNDLLTYARPRPPNRQPTDLPGVLDEVLRWVGPAADAAGVVCRLDVAGNALQISADPEQLKQLFGNLVLNAIQAMPAGGRLTLTQRPLDGISRTRRAVEVAVEDTGAGISEADLPRRDRARAGDLHADCSGARRNDSRRADGSERHDNPCDASGGGSGEWLNRRAVSWWWMMNRRCGSCSRPS